MFCYQCEQTVKEQGCTAFGACGKDPETSALQDLLVYAVKDICRYAHGAYELGARDRDVDVFTVEAMFSTLTNVNFDAKRFGEYLTRATAIKERAKQLYEDAEKKAGRTPKEMTCPVAWWDNTADLDDLICKGESVGIESRIMELGNDIASLQEILTYGIKGMAAYADHAQILGAEDETIYAYIHKAMDYLTRRPVKSDELLNLILECGKVNLRTMEILDGIHTSTYGHPEPTNVRITPVAGKCIAVSGHDLKEPRRTAQTDRGQRHKCLHTRRDAGLQRLSGPEKVRPFRRAFRRGLAGPEEGF
jgi:hydroxylamine reductase